jgi:hypothetical protein
MSETTTNTRTASGSPVLDPVVYWRVSAFALAAVALLGIVLTATGNEDLLGGFLTFDWPHNVLHVVLAAAAFLFGFAALPGRAVKAVATVFGAVYAGLGVLGVFLAEVGPIHLELGENLVHLLLGAWGLLAGLLGKA